MCHGMREYVRWLSVESAGKAVGCRLMASVIVWSGCGSRLEMSQVMVGSSSLRWSAVGGVGGGGGALLELWECWVSSSWKGDGDGRGELCSGVGEAWLVCRWVEWSGCGSRGVVERSWWCW
eukprot:15436450-Alexandrium_andersonii.AAC.1